MGRKANGAVSQPALPGAQEGDPAALWVPISKLTPWAKNPRKNDESVDDVARSIIELGWGRPLIAREANGELCVGHTTRKAVLSLKERYQRANAEQRAGWHPEAVHTVETGLVPVRFVTLSERKAHQLALADNRLAEKSDWDVPVLLDVMEELDLAEIEVAGWSSDDLAELGKDLLGGDGDAEDVKEDEAPEPPKDPITKPGDVWFLGDHVLVCGDSTVLHSVFAPKGARLMITDPPYGVSYAEKNEYLNKSDKGNRVQTPIENDHLGAGDMAKLWRSAFSIAREIVGPGAAYYVTGPQGRDLFGLAAALDDTGFPLRHMLVWVKSQFVIGRSDYHYKHEPILYGWTEGAAHKAVENRSETSTWEIDKPRRSELHPTMKPVELYARAMRNSSERGWIVYEPFAGSGTCFAAAAQMERRCWGVELSPAYCDVIVERWQSLTGGNATRRAA